MTIPKHARRLRWAATATVLATVVTALTIPITTAAAPIGRTSTDPATAPHLDAAPLFPTGISPCVSANTAWPEIVEHTTGDPCYLATSGGASMHGANPGDVVLPHTSLTLSVAGYPSNWPNSDAAWLLSWNNMWDDWPLIRGSNGAYSNDLVGDSGLYQIPPEISLTGCYDPAQSYLYGRWVPSCTVTFGKGPYYGTPAGSTMPYTILTAATQMNGASWNNPIVTNCSGTCSLVWRWQNTFVELPVMLQPSPYARFTTAPSGEGVQFTDTTLSDLQVTSRTWNFDDGATSSEQNPRHVFGTSRTHHVTLTVTVSDGQTDTYTMDVTPVASNQPTAAFTVTPTETPGQYQLVSTSTDPNNDVLQQEWSVPGASWTSSTTGPAITTMFDTPGTYPTTLTVTNSAGRTDSVSHDIVVSAPTLSASIYIDGSADVSPGDSITARVEVSASTDGVGDLNDLHFDASVGDGVLVSSNVALATLDTGPNPPLPSTLSPGGSMTLTYQLTAGAVGTGVLLTEVLGTDAAGRAVSAESSTNLKVSTHSLKVTITPAKTGFELQPDPADPEKVLPETVLVDIAVENTGDGDVDNVQLGPLDIVAADPQHPYTPFPVAVTLPNDTDALGTLAGGEIRHTTRALTVSGDGSFELRALATSADGNVLGATDFEVGVVTMLVMEIDGPADRQTTAGGTIIIRGRFTNVTNDQTVAITDVMKVMRDGNLLGGGLIADGGVDLSDDFPAPLLGPIPPGESREFQVRFTTSRPTLWDYDNGTWNSNEWTQAHVSLRFSPRAGVREDDNTWSALTASTITVQMPGAPPSSKYPGSIGFKGETAIDISIDTHETRTEADMVTRAGAAAFGLSIGALEEAQLHATTLVSLISHTPQFVLDTDFRDRQIAELMPDLRTSASLNYLAEMAVWLPSATITEIEQAVGQRLHDVYQGFTETVEGGIPHPQSPTVDAIADMAHQYVLTLQGNWRRGNPNAIIDSFRPLGQAVGGIATDVALQEAVFEGVAALLRAPRYLAAAVPRWRDANTIEKMRATLPSAAQQTLELKAGEVSKSNFPLLEETYVTGRPLTDLELGVGANNDGAGISAEVITRNRQYSKDTGTVIVVLPNEPGVAAALDAGTAIGKIENVKPKTLAEIEHLVFGGRLEDLNRVVLRDLGLTKSEADAAIQAAIDAGTIAADDRVIAESIWQRRRYEWAKFQAGGDVDKVTLLPKIDPATGKIAADPEGIGNLKTYDLNGKIPNQFRGADNRLQVNGPQELIDFFLLHVEEGYVVPFMRNLKTGLMVPITGDVDGIFIGLANGLGLPTSLLERAYASLMDVYNHPFSDTWLAAMNKKLGIFSKYFDEQLIDGVTRNGSPLVMFKDGEAYAVKIDAYATRFDPILNRAFIAWKGAPMSVDPSVVAQIFPVMSAIPAPVYFLGLPATFLRMFLPKVNGTTPKLPTARQGKVVRLNAAGGVESWTAAGGWQDDPSVVAAAVSGSLAILPETMTSGATAPGATELPIASQDEMAMTGAWFQVGDVVVLDPGGPNQETATIAGFGSLIFDHPLTRPHERGELVALLPSDAAAGGPIAMFQPVVPARLLETRTGTGMQTVDHQSEGIGVRDAGSVTELLVAGRGGVDGAASAVALNVAVVDARGPGFVTVYPCGQDRPNAANLNYVTGQTIANAVLAKVGNGGKVCLFTYGAIDLAVDVDGWYPNGAAYDPVAPARLLETRTGTGMQTVDHQSEGIGVRDAGSVTELLVAGRGGVDGAASAVALNVAVVDARGPGFVTVYPCGQDRPNAANLNYVTGQTIANAVLAKVGNGGKVCLFTYGAIDLVVDVDGWFPASTDYSPLVPARLLETRTGTGMGTVDHQSEGIGVRDAGSVTELLVAGRGGVDAHPTAVVLNVAVVDARGPGFVTVYPCGQDRPNAANLNYVAGDTRPNAVVARVGDGGKVCVFTYAAVDLAIDVQGDFAPVA